MRDWERILAISCLTKQMVGITIKASTFVSGFEGEFSEHRVSVFGRIAKTIELWRNEIAGEQRDAYVNR